MRQSKQPGEVQGGGAARVAARGWSIWGLRLPGLWAVALATAALADFLFYKQWVGWTLGGFVLFVLLLILLRHGRGLWLSRAKIRSGVLAGLAAGLVAAMVLEPGALAFILAMIALGSLTLLARGGWSSGQLGWAWLGRLFGLMGQCVVRPLLDSRLARRWKLRAGTELIGRWWAGAKLAWGVLGIVVPLVFGLVFLGLFCAANPVIAQWVSQRAADVGDVLVNLTDYLSFGRVMLWYLAGFGVWGLLRYRRPRRRHRRVPQRARQAGPAGPAGDSDPAHAAAGQSAAQAGLAVKHATQLAQQQAQQQVPQADSQARVAQSAARDSQAARDSEKMQWLAMRFAELAVRTLVVLNLLFAAQIILDGRYLLLGGKLPEGMTYATYAHRGAYPLMATALLAGGLVLAVFRPGGVAEASKWARWLVLVWISQNVVLMLTAAWRLGMYVEVYSLTRLRIAAAVWMLLVAGGLVLLLWRISVGRDNVWLTGRTMGWALAVLYVCCFVPFDPMIAGYNVSHCRELAGHDTKAPPIDVDYLENLGPDALPAIAHLLDALPPAIADQPPSPTNTSVMGGAGFVTSRGESSSASAPRDESASLREELQRVQAGLVQRLNGQLDGWRGWTVRRAWLRWMIAD